MTVKDNFGLATCLAAFDCSYWSEALLSQTLEEKQKNAPHLYCRQ